MKLFKLQLYDKYTDENSNRKVMNMVLKNIEIK